MKLKVHNCLLKELDWHGNPISEKNRCKELFFSLGEIHSTFRIDSMSFYPSWINDKRRLPWYFCNIKKDNKMTYSIMNNNSEIISMPSK